MTHPDTPLQRKLALATDAALRLRVQTLVEQCEREEINASGAVGDAAAPWLTTKEIYTLLGLGRAR